MGGQFSLELGGQFDRFFQSEDLPLKKSLYCPECMNLMTGFLVKAKGLFYYKCQKKCKGVVSSANKLHQSFVSLLNEYQFNLNNLDEIVPEIMQHKLIEMSKSDANEVAASKTKLAKARKDIETIGGKNYEPQPNEFKP
jgi:site-specific DNA recombinase